MKRSLFPKSHPQPESLSWRDRFQIASSALVFLLGGTIAARCIAEQVYAGLIAASAFISWGGVRIYYIWSYYKWRSKR